MKKFAYFLTYVFIASTLMACGISGQTDKLIKPGDKIGKMTVEQGYTGSSRNIWLFCEFMPDEYEPFSFTNECDIPSHMSNLNINFGWLATEENFASNWDAMTWELYIDDYQIDLKAFECIEGTDRENTKYRDWFITLKNLTPGVHTLRLSWTSETAVDDGFNIYQPGTYEQVTIFTVSE